uniref:Uncharacterized protein n=1 Tax=Ditylenchus dipsaci TaxID=166011 RepID=A0A915D2D9_9BILA
MIVGSPTQSQFSDANQEDSANRKKRKTNLSNSTPNCVPGVELEYIEDRDVRKQHIVWNLFVEIKINYKGIDYERMYCPSCNADMVPKTSVLKAHLNARHEKVSKAVMKIERRKKKTELIRTDCNEAFALVLSIPCLSLNIFTHPYVRAWVNIISKESHWKLFAMENSFISVSSDSDSEIILERKPAKKPEVETLSDEDSPSIERKPSQSPEVVEGKSAAITIIIYQVSEAHYYRRTKESGDVQRLVSVDPEKRLYGGKMTDQRMNKVHQITGDVIAAIHSAATQAPINVPTECDGLLIDLMPHQKFALTWMLWREKQLKGPGGILGDDMGLGKTLSMIALILHSKNERIKAEKTSKVELLEDNKRPLSCKTIWEKEVTDRVKENLLRVHIFHGPKNKREISAKKLSQYDMVITTYQTVSSELSEKFKIDEDFAALDTKKYVSITSGSVLTKAVLVSKSCCKLNAGARWCLTGTPIHNELWDLRKGKVWKESIMSASKSNADRLNCLVKVFITKDENQICEVTNKPIVDLKPRLYELIELTLQEPEDRCYQVMFDASRQKQVERVKNPFLMGMREIRNGDKFQQMSCVLVLLLRLRQACTHFGLLKHAVDMNAFKEDAGEVGAGLDNLEESMAQMSLDEEQLLNQIEDADGTKIDAEKIFEPDYQSTKVNAVLERMEKLQRQAINAS